MIKTFAVSVLALSIFVARASGIELIGAVRESAGGPPAGAPTPCPLVLNLNGICGNYRWYNVCSGYIWLYASGPNCVGVQFGGPSQHCVAPGNVVRRAITYWRDVVPNYSQTVDIYLDRDVDGNGCPDAVMASDLDLDPGLRWNCSNFGTPIPAGANFVVVRTLTGGSFPTIATDGPFTEQCDPVGNDHSFYYGTDCARVCIPWRNISPTGRGDNFLYWLIVDGPPTATQETSWGSIKGLYD